VHEYSGSKKYEIVNMFPRELILSLLEKSSQEALIVLRAQDFYSKMQSWEELWDPSKKAQSTQKWSLFWHVDFMLAIQVLTADQIFDLLFTQQETNPEKIPESYLSLAYLIVNHLEPTEGLRRLNMLQILD